MRDWRPLALSALAVPRTALGWALWSWRRLGLCLAGVLVLGVLFHAVRSPGPSTVSTTDPTTTTVTPAAQTGVSTPSVPSAAISRAVFFVTAYARPQLGESAWYASLRSLCTPAEGVVLSEQQPWAVTSHKVTGTASGSSSGSSANVTVPTDAGPVIVELEVNGSTWLVASLEQS